MKTVIYLDVLLLVNFIIDYFLLQAAGLLCGGRPGFGRSLLGAGVGAGAALALLVPPLPFWAQAAYQALSAAAVVRCAFAWRGLQSFVRRAVWYFALNLCLAGAVILAAGRGAAVAETNNLAVYLHLSPGLLLVCALGVWAGLRLVTLLPGSRGPQKTERLKIRCGSAEFTLTALLDTGFSLREPIGGSPVLLVSLPAVRAALPLAVGDYLNAWYSAAPAVQAAMPPPGGFSLRLVPLHTAAGAALAPALLLPVTRVLGNGQMQKRLPGVPVAFCNETFSSREFAALLGAELLRELT